MAASWPERRSLILAWFIAFSIVWVIGMGGLYVNRNHPRGSQYKVGIVFAVIGLVGATVCVGASI